MKVKPFSIMRVEVYLGRSVGRVYRWRSRCGFCPAPGYLYSHTFLDARDSVVEHMDRHQDVMVLPLDGDHAVPSGPAVSTWAQALAYTMAEKSGRRVDLDALAMLPDEDEAQQFRNLPSV